LKKLTYEKIADSLIKIELQNDYNVIAIITTKELRYDVSLYLVHKETSLYDLMGDYEHLTFNATNKTIYSAVLKEVATLMENNKFNRYFERYEYMLDCFDKGNEFYEQERKGDN
jgi:hypothetical protein